MLILQMMIYYMQRAKKTSWLVNFKKKTGKTQDEVNSWLNGL
jgi:hypothetical protein